MTETKSQNAEVRDQPPPIPNEGIPVWELVIADMKDRDNVGRERYGTPLQTFNGRDALTDAYQEALDLVVYMRQAIEEEAQRQTTLAAAAEAGLDLVTVDHVAEALLNAENRQGPKSPKWLNLSDYTARYVHDLRIAAIVAMTERTPSEAGVLLATLGLGVQPAFKPR